MGRIPHPALVDPPRWRALRQAILRRDAYRCQACGAAGRLEVDHVVPVQHGGDWWSPEALQALCRQCHLAKSAGERRQGKPDPERAAWAKLIDAKQ